MKVLFVSSGNSINGISPIIKNQGESLSHQGIQLNYFTINGKGLFGYLKNVSILRQAILRNNYDIIHAHYSMSAFVASLANARPLVVSLMGSDVKAKPYYKYLIRLFNKLSWSKLIVKSEEMKSLLGIDNVGVISNGVDFDKFKPINKSLAINKLGWNMNNKHILFAANPNRFVKNFQLAKSAFDLLDNTEIEMHFLEDVSNELMPYYHNAADVVLLTSFWEGSPNVIKEAMACCRPIVATDVGDVKKLIGGTAGCFVSDFQKERISSDLRIALEFNSMTLGRQNISHLDSKIVAYQLIDCYKKILS